MKHLALYRKWRPQRFSEVVGQEHVSRTLLNAIRRDRLAHAYLFCGPRGTGKTTSARLLAKALNCSEPQDAEPCNNCQNCQEITAGNSLDVIEIDAASNRGIDSARDLREQVRFATSSGRYRVFIIDEFHMLTKEAFNALLKTLEEPPENVIFVLATTEPHEVLQTIVSRCQRFDFQRIGVRQLCAHLKVVAEAEGIGVSEGALDAIARKANGGLRDGLSLLDQVQALSIPGETLEDTLVYQTLGLVQEDELFALLQAGFAGELEPLLATLRLLLEQGHDAMQIVQDLIQLLRHLSLAYLSPERLEELGVPGHLVEQIQKMGQQLSRGAIVHAIDTLIKTSDRLHHCAQPDIWLEADLIAFCLQAESPLLQRVEQLEQQIKAGVPMASPPSRAVERKTPPPTAPVSTTPQKPRSTQSEAPSRSPSVPPASPPVASPELRQNLDVQPERLETASEPESISVPSSESSTEFVTETSFSEPQAPANVPVDTQDTAALWKQFLQRVAQEHPPMYGFISSGQLSHVDRQNRVWMVEFVHNNKALLRRLQQKMQDGKLQSLVSDMMGAPFELETRLQKEKKTLNDDVGAQFSSSAPAVAPQPAPNIPKAPERTPSSAVQTESTSEAVLVSPPQPSEALSPSAHPASNSSVAPKAKPESSPRKAADPDDEFPDAPPSDFDDGYVPSEPFDLPEEDFVPSPPKKRASATVSPKKTEPPKASKLKPSNGNGNGHKHEAAQVVQQNPEAQKAKAEPPSDAQKSTVLDSEKSLAPTQAKSSKEANPQLLQNVAELFKGRIVEIRE